MRPLDEQEAIGKVDKGNRSGGNRDDSHHLQCELENALNRIRAFIILGKEAKSVK